MKTDIEKERIKKFNWKVYSIIGAILYIYGSLVYFHYDTLSITTKRMSTSARFNMALTRVFTEPGEIFPLSWGKISTLIVATLAIGIILFMVIAEQKLKKSDNPDTVNGEAHFMNSKELADYSRDFIAPLGEEKTDGFNNMIISKEIKLAIDNSGTRRNCNILVIGGSGAGKSRFFAAPNILQFNANFVITDPSGEMLRDYGKILENEGYNVKVFNLVDVYRSNKYNPFHYIKEEKDVFTLVNTLIKNTTPPESKAGDPFWEKSENLLLSSLILYLWHKAPEEKQNFSEVLRLLDMAKIDENDDNAQSPLDLIMNDLRKEDSENLAVRQYDKFKIGAGKTLKSILISVGVRLQSFDLSDIKYLTSKDEFEFESFADTKQAVFVIIPTADTTFNFIVSMMYSQLFSSLYYYAETRACYGWKASINKFTNIRVEQAANAEESPLAKKKLESFVRDIRAGVKIVPDKTKKLYKVYTKKGNQLVGWRGTKDSCQKFIKQLEHIKISPCEEKCPNHVRLILDEFANIGQIPDFDQKLATMRKYEISCSIILQALSQLKELYKDKWNTIVANCDTKLFLGCDDSETIEWLLKMLGKKTTTVRNESFSAKGQGSTSLNKSSLELMTIDQVTMMQADECLVRVRGCRPYYGKKYELTEHPAYERAKKTKNTFVIPVAKDVVEGRSKNRPLRERIKELEINQNGDVIEKKKNETKEKNIGNKQKAEKAKNNIQPENIGLPVDFLEELGITPNSSKESIKEAIESCLIFDDIPPEGALTYSMTN